MKILLYNDVEVLIDSEAWTLVKDYSWSLLVANGGNMYAYDQTRKVKMHHLILVPKEGFIIDHRNLNGLDNRKENLRYATCSQNKANGNRYKCGSSGGYKGVYARKDKFRATIRVEGTLKSLGTFLNAEEAAIAYNKAATKAFGEYAQLNVV